MSNNYTNLIEKYEKMLNEHKEKIIAIDSQISLLEKTKELQTELISELSKYHHLQNKYKGLKEYVDDKEKVINEIIISEDKKDKQLQTLTVNDINIKALNMYQN